MSNTTTATDNPSRFAPARNSEGYQFDYLVFIGRFQPFHLGHKSVIDQALTLAKDVIILIGSANLPRSTRNSFTVAERTKMILGAYSAEDAARIHCVGLDDALYRAGTSKWDSISGRGSPGMSHGLYQNLKKAPPFSGAPRPSKKWTSSLF